MPKQISERITVEKSQMVEISGTLLLPQTITVRNDSVNTGTIEIKVAGKIYTYKRKLHGLYKADSAHEIIVPAGTRISATAPVKLTMVLDL